ncbi:hypothetical protein QP991_05785 [Corynebacterium amycolatum]|nr:hypothetical protein [Corynebacterium amycolatum]MDK8819033.1 hypothetical protein [Corynebacterium amycolatum]
MSIDFFGCEEFCEQSFDAGDCPLVLAALLVFLDFGGGSCG